MDASLRRDLDRIISRLRRNRALINLKANVCLERIRGEHFWRSEGIAQESRDVIRSCLVEIEALSKEGK